MISRLSPKRIGNSIRIQVSLRTVLFVFILVGATLSHNAMAQLPAPDGMGNYGVGYQRIELVDPSRNNRVLQTDIWYPVDSNTPQSPLASYRPLADEEFGFPSDVAIDQAPLAMDGPFPLIINSHGGWTWSGQDSHVNEILASHGFIVAAPEHMGESVQSASLSGTESAIERPKDISFVIDEMFAKNGNPTDDFFQGVQSEYAGIYGISFGAYTSLAAHSGNPLNGIPSDSRIKATMPISTSRGQWIGTQINYDSTIPTFLLTGTRDGGVPSHHSQLFQSFTQDGIDNAVYSAVIDDAVHTSYAEVCQRREFAVENGAPEPVIALYDALVDSVNNCASFVIDNMEAVRTTTLYAVAFFHTYLNDNSDYNEFLTPEYTEDNLAATLVASLPDINEPMPGDFDSDGDIDGTDFLRWQQGESPNPLSESDLQDWQLGFGTLTTNLTSRNTAVPEPSSVILLMLAVVGGCLGRARLANNVAQRSDRLGPR